MKIKKLFPILFSFFCFSLAFAQEDSVAAAKDSLNLVLLDDYNKKLRHIENQRLLDSLKKEELHREIEALKTTDNLKKEELQAQLLAITEKENKRLKDKKTQIDSLKKVTTGYPVYGFFKDTLFFLYSKTGSFSPKERAEAASKKIQRVGELARFDKESLVIVKAGNTEDIVYEEIIIIGVSETDGLWNDMSPEMLAGEYRDKIAAAIERYHQETDVLTIARKVGLAILVIIVIAALVKYISKFFNWIAVKIQMQRGLKIKGVQIKNYTLFDADAQINVLLLANRIVKWIIILTAIYVALPVLFGLFPWTEHFASTLFGYIANPLKRIFLSFWHYLPDLITIAVIIVIFRYILRLTAYLKNEIARGNLVINGFYRDWAEPTYHIVRVLLIAFMLVVVWPYLPGSDSPIFKGVSVFLGFLFTFGSAGSLSNIIAGLVLTYMRLFTIGDRVRIGDVSGDVIEKSLLVTRVRTSQNEIISIPNSTVMNSHTINYSADAPDKGLIIHTKVRIGYDVPWKEVHEALIEAALRTDMILKEPAPFVQQVSLEEFYAIYDLNAYIREANRQGSIYSRLHENIQDVFRERNIEIMSPHYLVQHDGGQK